MIEPEPHEIEVKYTSVFARTAASKKKIIVNVGGARSSKSFSVAQLLVSRFLSIPKREIIVTRKTFPALRATAMSDIISILQDWGVYWALDHNKSENVIRNPENAAIIRFISVDAPATKGQGPIKIRSMGANDIWMEEANEFTYADFLTLKTRLSRPLCGGLRNQMFLTLNPSDAYGWINMKLVSPAQDDADKDASDVQVIVSSYKDNPSLDADYVSTLEGLKEEDETYYQIFALGVWAAAKSIIYSKFKIVAPSSFPANFDEMLGGLDFGFNNPSAAVTVDVLDGIPWVRERVYQSKLTNSELIDRVKETTPDWKRRLWAADSAEPDRIEEFKAAGFDVEPVKKGPTSVRDGIDFARRYSWRIANDAVNTIKEVRGYKWREKDGVVLDEPVKFMDHAMDATRYAFTRLRSFTEPQAVGSAPAIARGQRVRGVARLNDPRRYGRSQF